MDRAQTTGSHGRRVSGSGKILEFSVAYTAKQQEPSGHLALARQSWSRQAGVSDQERLLALAFGALLTPAVWAGHALLVWMHLL